MNSKDSNSLSHVNGHTETPLTNWNGSIVLKGTVGFHLMTTAEMSLYIID